MPDAPAKDAPSTTTTTTAPGASSPADQAARASSTSPSGSPPGKDVVLLGPPTADGGGVHVLRAREERIEVGELRALEEGKPIRGEIVSLAPRKDNPRVCDVKESYAPLAAPKGPAKVATAAYREGWDEIFGGKPAVDRDLN